MCVYTMYVHLDFGMLHMLSYDECISRTLVWVLDLHGRICAPIKGTFNNFVSR